jgi:hypothetical protein
MGVLVFHVRLELKQRAVVGFAKPVFRPGNERELLIRLRINGAWNEEAGGQDKKRVRTMLSNDSHDHIAAMMRAGHWSGRSSTRSDRAVKCGAKRASTASAARYPLRTAPSIVAGHPVCV